MTENCQKWPKIVQNCPKLKGYLSNYIFHTVDGIGERQLVGITPPTALKCGHYTETALTKYPQNEAKN